VVQQSASGNAGGGFFTGIPGVVNTGGGTGSSGGGSSDTFGNFLSEVINPLGALGFNL
jgi:hypothetical protein